MVIGTVLATVLLTATTGHGAVIKRESSSISEQELVAEELLAAPSSIVTTAASPLKLETTKKQEDYEAIRDANRISLDGELKETKAEKNKVNETTSQITVHGDAVEDEAHDEEEDEDEAPSTAEPFDAADARAADTPIPTFPPSIDR